MKVDLKYIEKLIKLMSDKDVTEVQLADDEQSIVLKREKQFVTGTTTVQLSEQKIVTEKKEKATDEIKSGRAITSPMVGTFYKSPSPDAPPFIEVGGLIAQGEVVCIIEAMKLMNEIESDYSGRVVEICVEDGQPVEYGQVLMYVE